MQPVRLDLQRNREKPTLTKAGVEDWLPRDVVTTFTQAATQPSNVWRIPYDRTSTVEVVVRVDQGSRVLAPSEYAVGYQTGLVTVSFNTGNLYSGTAQLIARNGNTPLAPTTEAEQPLIRVDTRGSLVLLDSESQPTSSRIILQVEMTTPSGLVTTTTLQALAYKIEPWTATVVWVRDITRHVVFTIDRKAIETLNLSPGTTLRVIGRLDGMGNVVAIRPLTLLIAMTATVGSVPTPVLSEAIDVTSVLTKLTVSGSDILAPPQAITTISPIIRFVGRA
jgi:hypothetical protein